MSNCVGDSCGVGGWGGPAPGDPSHESILTATPAYGGIDVSWTFPVTHPESVAYTQLYRANLDNFLVAIPIANVGGSFFYDKQTNGNTYFYWIRFVSRFGTLGPVIGPASAAAKPLIEQMIELLTGEIDAGVLAQALRARIDRIETIELDLATEVRSRENDHITLGQALADVDAGVSQTLTFLADERTSRIHGLSAMASALDLVAATSLANVAAIQTRVDAKIEVMDGKVTVVGNQVTQVAAQAADDLAQVNSHLHAEVVTVDGRVAALSTQVDQVIANAGDGVAAVEQRLTGKIETVEARVTNLASAVTSVESAAANNLAQVQQSMTTNIQTVEGKITDIGALWTAKVSVNGLIGGFGVYNDGNVVEAGFDVDRFWVGRTGADKRKPFIIENDGVYIDDAAINKLTFSKLRDEAGALVVEDGKVKATYLKVDQLDALSARIGTLRTATSGARLEISDDVIKVFDSAGTLRVRLGNLSL